MTGVVFRNTLNRNWRTGLYWGIGIALLGIYAILIIPNVDMLNSYAQLVQTMPPLLLQAFGVDDISSMTTPDGFLGFAFFSYALLILAAYAVIAGLNITANEEDRGIMDITLSLPIPRWRLVLERFLAYTVIVVAILALSFLGMWGATLTSNTLQFDVGRMALGILNMMPSVLLMLAFTALAGTVMRSRSGAAALAAGFVIVSYFIDFLGKAASESAAGSLRLISFFNYYNGSDIMTTGLNAGNFALLSVVMVVFAVGALWFFQRRDVGV